MSKQQVVGVIAAASGIAMAATPAADVAAFMALPQPAPSAELRYGPASAQAVDVFVPDQPGPHPVAILIHGGCWSVRTAGREQLRPLGADLARRGVVAWSIGYRRANESGGGYPGTYQDVGAAIDLLQSQARSLRLDLSRTVLVGHSAGGHLALWAAARSDLPAGSPLRTSNPFVPKQVISLAGIADLQAHAAGICGPEIAQRLGRHDAPDSLGGAYLDVSPSVLPPPAADVVMVSALLDRVVPPALASEHVQAMRSKGMASISLVPVPGSGHFDLVTPGSAAWAQVWARIEAATARR